MEHQTFIEHIAKAALARLPESERKDVAAKITYGAGRPGLRGVTYFDVWQSAESTQIPLVEICAFGEQDKVQLAGTTIHELAHVLAGLKGGHGKPWKDACKRLGLRRCLAAGTHYQLASFDPDIRFVVAELPEPVDGRPNIGYSAGAQGAMTMAPAGLPKIRPCTLGYGSRGGKSRGKGSGSRLRKWVCDCGVIVRVSSDDFRATCDRCESHFHQE